EATLGGTNFNLITRMFESGIDAPLAQATIRMLDDLTPEQGKAWISLASTGWNAPWTNTTAIATLLMRPNVKVVADVPAEVKRVVAKVGAVADLKLDKPDLDVIWDHYLDARSFSNPGQRTQAIAVLERVVDLGDGSLRK